jgi:peptidylprolyl isomerase
VNSENEDTSGEPEVDEQPVPEDDAEPVGPLTVDGGDGDGPGDDGDDEPDWEYVLARVSRDAATTKMLVGILIVVVVVASVVLGVLIRTNDTSTTKSASAIPSTSSTTTTPALDSVAGQPCVALADPLPAGAPPMDIEVGPAPTTLVTKDIKEGTGAVATATSTVSVNYVAVACSTGKIFDTSYKGGTPTPVSIPLAQVIPGFAQGVTGMKVGGQRLIGIPSDQAYGSQGGGTAIAPDEALWFVVELTAVTP